MAVFDDRLQDILITAKKLELSGEASAMRELLLQAVKDTATYKKKDLLSIFYGEKVYENVDSVERAMSYIYIAKVLSDVYTELEMYLSASSTGKAWATCGKYTGEHGASAVLDFFMWLSTSRKIDKADDTRYLSFVNALKDTPITFDISKGLFKANIQDMRPVDIIEGIVSGNIEVTKGGKLR